MKYEFKKNDIDEYTLIYSNKENKEVKKNFKRTIEMAEKLQGITAKARIVMSKELSKMGLTKEDLIIKRDLGNGKTTYDESNYRETEKQFIEEESMKTANELIEICFETNVLELFKDMGININEEQNITVEEQNSISQFIQKFMIIIKGNEENTPSDTSKKEQE